MRLAILLPLLMFASFPASPAAPETDASKAVRFTAALEADPFHADAPQMRHWLMQWLTDTRDYNVLVCDIFGPLPAQQTARYGAELLAQQMFGNVAYQITHPGKNDQATLQVAGMESLLKAYAVIIEKEPKAHLRYFDMLLARQKQNALKVYLAPIIARGCSRPPA